MTSRVFLVMGLIVVAIAATGCGRSRRADETVACTPGDSLRISCGGGAGCGGSCTGDPTISVCETTVASCTRETSLAYDDDSCDGFCPGVTVTCPSSGEVLVRTAPWGSSGEFTCDWEVESLTGLTPE